MLLIVDVQGWVRVPGALHYLYSFGPALAAVILTARFRSAQGLADLGVRITQWRIGGHWLLLAAGSPLLLAGLAVLVNYGLTGTWPAVQTTGQVEYLGNIGVVGGLLLWLLTFGVGEETSWRGYALPNLQQRQHWLIAALVIGGFWAVWHLPSFFYKPQLMAVGLIGFPGFALGVIAGSILLAGLYNASGGSILAVALWHGLFDFLTTAPWAQGIIAAIMSAVVMIAASIIVVVVLWRVYHPPPALRPTPLPLVGNYKGT